VIDRWTEAKVVARLRELFPAPEFALVASVRSAAGYDARGTMDAFAINTWPSRGLVRHGFEVKVSRNDWLKELKKPAKAELFARLCHHWWIVVPDADIVKIDTELPPTWGLIDVSRPRKPIVKAAPTLEPGDLPMGFVAALMRRCTEQSVDAAALATARAEGREEGFRAGQLGVEAQVGRDADDLAHLRAAVTKFTEVSGVDINRCTVVGRNLPWRRGGIEGIGKAVAALLHMEAGDEDFENWLIQAERKLNEQLERVRDLREASS
jgi:hypothetical protein